MSPFSKVKMSPFVVTRGDENAEEDNYDESKRVKPLRGYAKNRIKSFIEKKGSRTTIAKQETGDSFI